MSDTPETIYLIPGEDDHGRGMAWCDSPAPGEGMDPAEAVRYVRADHIADSSKMAQGVHPNGGVPEWMGEISANLKTQDNRVTADPLFVVYQKREIVTHEDFDYDRISWGSSDGEAPEHIQDELNELYDDVYSDHFHDDRITLTTDECTETWQRAAIKEIDEFVTACFTEAGAKAYLESNGHNLNQPFIFATSLYRNEEMKHLRDWLLTDTAQAGREAEARELMQKAATLEAAAQELEDDWGEIFAADELLTKAAAMTQEANRLRNGGSDSE